jgi:proteic killer suppression protein
MMIASYRCRDTAAILTGHTPARFKAFADVAERKLRPSDGAEALDDLRVPPGNRLEALRGNRAGQHSIRVNAQWRVCFRWAGGDAFEVEIVDYR